PAGVRPVARSRSTPRARRRASSPRPCDAPTPASQRHTSPPAPQQPRPEAPARAPYPIAGLPAAEPADADTYVPGYRPVQRTSKPAFPPPLLGPRGLRRDLMNMLSPQPPDPQLHRRLRQRELQLLDLGSLSSLNRGAVLTARARHHVLQPSLARLQEPVPPLRDRLPRRAVPPRCLGNRQLTRQHRQHNPHPLLDRQLRMPAPTHQPILPAGPQNI